MKSFKNQQPRHRFMFSFLCALFLALHLPLFLNYNNFQQPNNSIHAYEWKMCKNVEMTIPVTKNNDTSVINNDGPSFVNNTITSCEVIPFPIAKYKLKIYEEIPYFSVREYFDTTTENLCDKQIIKNTLQNDLINLLNKNLSNEIVNDFRNVTENNLCSFYFLNFFRAELNKLRSDSFYRIHVKMLNFCKFCWNEEFITFSNSLQYLKTNNFILNNNNLSNLTNAIHQISKEYPLQKYNYISLPTNQKEYCGNANSEILFYYQPSFLSLNYTTPYFCFCKHSGVYATSCDYYSIFSLPFTSKALPFLMYFITIISAIIVFIFLYIPSLNLLFFDKEIKMEKKRKRMKDFIMDPRFHISHLILFCLICLSLQHIMSMANYNLDQALQYHIGDPFFRCISLLLCFDAFFVTCSIWINTLIISLRNLQKKQDVHFHFIIKIIVILNHCITFTLILLLFAYLIALNIEGKTVTMVINIIFFVIIIFWVLFFTFGFLITGIILYKKLTIFNKKNPLELKFMKFTIFNSLVSISVLVQMIFIIIEFMVSGVQFGLVYRDSNFYGLDVCIILYSLSLSYQICDIIEIKKYLFCKKIEEEK
ncbi:hypothetical protein ABK040_006863 [Willaertia magna]